GAHQRFSGGEPGEPGEADHHHAPGDMHEFAAAKADEEDDDEADTHGHAHAAAALGSRPAELITSGFLVLSALLSWIAFFTVGFGKEKILRIPVFNWFSSGTLAVDWAFRIDTLTVVMLVVVTTVSA